MNDPKPMVTDAQTDIVLETPASEPESAEEPRSLPFSFAKRHGVLIR